MKVFTKSLVLLISTLGVYKVLNKIPVVYRKDENAFLPVIGTAESAGVDLVTPNDFTISPGEVYKVHTGVVIHPPRGYYTSLHTRSGLSINHGIILANGTCGVVDSDYDNGIIVALRNVSDKPHTFSKGDRVAQAVFIKYSRPRFVKENVFWKQVLKVRKKLAELQGWTPRSGGLGSTGN